MDFEDILVLLSILLRLLGMLAFGVGVGWFTLEAFRKGQKAWQFQMAVFLGLLGIAIAVVRFASPGAVGAYTLGAGVGLLVWGLTKPKADDK